MANSSEYKYKIYLPLTEAVKVEDVVTVELKSAKIADADNFLTAIDSVTGTIATAQN